MENKSFPRKKKASRNLRMDLFLGDTIENGYTSEPKIKVLVQNTLGLARSKVKTPFDKGLDVLSNVQLNEYLVGFSFFLLKPLDWRPKHIHHKRNSKR